MQYAARMKTYRIMDGVHLREKPRWSLYLDERSSGGDLTRLSGHTTRQEAESAKAELERLDTEYGDLLGAPQTHNVGEALKALIEAISASPEIGSDKDRNELLEQIEALTQQAALPKEQHKRGVIKPLVDSLAGICSGAGGLAAVWQTWGPAISGYFSI